MNAFTGYFKNVKSKYKVKNHIVYYIMAAVTALFTVITLTGGIKMSSAFMLEQIGYFVIMAVSLSLVVGFFGEHSHGHAGFMFLGAYLGSYFKNTNAPDLIKTLPHI